MAVTPAQLGIPSGAQPAGGDKRTPGYTIQQWAAAVLSGLGVPVTSTNIGILVTWASVESGGYNPNASGGRYNPLNTTQPGHGGIGGGGQGNIMDYPTFQDGVAAIVENLQNPRFGYPAILAGLRAQNPSATFAAVNASSFGTHIAPGTNISGNTPSAQLTSSIIQQIPADLLPGGVGQLFPGGGGPVSGGSVLGTLFNLDIASGLRKDVIYIAEVVGGFLLVVLGVVIVLVDTGTLSKMPMPVPIPV